MKFLPARRVSLTMPQLSLLIALVLAQVAPRNAERTAPPDVDARRQQLAALLDEHWEYTMRTSPEYASMLGDTRKLGYADLKSFDAALAKNPDLHPRSREQMLELYRKSIDQMWAKLPRYFGRLPKAKVEVMPVEEYREKEASGAQYVEGTPDGSGPAT